MSVGHYENFPVASMLCPPPLRPAVRAIYRFARTADDLADEGDAPPAQRVAQLQAYRAALHDSFAGDHGGAWPDIFGPLRAAAERHALPVTPFDDLLDAFIQDCGNPRYATRAQLLDYCRRSANPIGRLMLALYGIDDALSLRQSDAICSALQLINFWQDPGVDLPRGRLYLPAEDAAAAGVDLDALLLRPADSPATQALLRTLCAWAAQLMTEGAPLALRLPGRAGWELRLVVQGGWRILERIARMDHRTLTRRPRLGPLDLAPMLWRAARMSARRPLPGWASA